MDEQELKRMMLARALFGIAEGDQRGIEAMRSQQVSPSFPEIPSMHQGKMFNIDGRQKTGGRAQSLDFYLQPSISPKGIGLNGAGIIFRKAY